MNSREQVHQALKGNNNSSFVEQTGLPPRVARDRSPINGGGGTTGVQRGDSVGRAGTPTPIGADSNGSRGMIGKAPEEIKLIKMMKQKLQTTTIPKLEFEDKLGHVSHFEDYYDYIKPLGCGSFGFVVSAVDKETGGFVALKIVDSVNESSIKCIKREASILEGLGYHPNVIQYRHIREFSNYIVLAIENAKGGTLADLIKRRCSNGGGGYSSRGVASETQSTQESNQSPPDSNQGELTDEECAKIVKGILLGVKHIHSFDFVHRDLKPSNVVIDDTNNLDTVKIVDFGLAIKVSLKHGLDDTCGTLVYQAPEQMFGETSYGKPIDLWAIGLIAYELIAGQHAIWLKGEDKQMYRDKMRHYKGLTFQSKKFTPLAISLIEKLCHSKPSARYKVDQALMHPWITRNFSDQIPRTLFEESIFQSEIVRKLLRSCHAVLFLSITKDYPRFQAERKEKRRIEQLEEEEKERQRLEKEAEARLIAIEQQRIKEQQEEVERRKREEEERFLEEMRLREEIEKKKIEEELMLMPQVTPDFASIKGAMPKGHLSILDGRRDSSVPRIGERNDRYNTDEIDKYLEIPNDKSPTEVVKETISQNIHPKRASLRQELSQEARKRYSMIRQSSELQAAVAHHELGSRSRQQDDKREIYTQKGIPDSTSNLNDVTQNISVLESDRSRSSSSLTANIGGTKGLMSGVGGGGNIDKSFNGKPPLSNNSHTMHRDHSANALRSTDGNSATISGQRTQKTFRIHKGSKRGQPIHQQQQLQAQQNLTQNSELIKSQQQGFKSSPSKRRGGADKQQPTTDSGVDTKVDISRKNSQERSLIREQLRNSATGGKIIFKKPRRNSSQHSADNQLASSSDEGDSQYDPLVLHGQTTHAGVTPQNDELPQDGIDHTITQQIGGVGVGGKSKKILTSGGTYVRRKSKYKHGAVGGSKRQKSLQPAQPSVIGQPQSSNQYITSNNIKQSAVIPISVSVGEQQQQQVRMKGLQTTSNNSSNNLAALVNQNPQQSKQTEVKVQKKLQTNKNPERDLSQTIPRSDLQMLQAPSSGGVAAIGQASSVTPQKPNQHPGTPIQPLPRKSTVQQAITNRGFNPSPGGGLQHQPQRKIVSAGIESFEVIKHGSHLKESKSPLQQQPLQTHIISVQGEFISPIKRLTEVVDSQQVPQTSIKKSAKVGFNPLMPCNEDPSEDKNNVGGLDRIPHFSTGKKSVMGVPIHHPQQPSSQTGSILSPFEQFLQNLIKQEKDQNANKTGLAGGGGGGPSSAGANQQHSLMQMQLQAEKTNRSKQVENVIKKNALNPVSGATTTTAQVTAGNLSQQYKSLKEAPSMTAIAQVATSQIQGSSVVSRDSSQNHSISQAQLQQFSRQRTSQTFINQQNQIQSANTSNSVNQSSHQQQQYDSVSSTNFQFVSVSDTQTIQAQAMSHANQQPQQSHFHHNSLLMAGDHHHHHLINSGGVSSINSTGDTQRMFRNSFLNQGSTNGSSQQQPQVGRGGGGGSGKAASSGSHHPTQSSINSKGFQNIAQYK